VTRAEKIADRLRAAFAPRHLDVVDESEAPDRATGIKFSEFTSAAVLEAIYRARRIFQRPESLRAYRKRGMARDFSGERTAAAYLDCYRRILGSAGPDSE